MEITKLLITLLIVWVIVFPLLLRLISINKRIEVLDKEIEKNESELARLIPKRHSLNLIRKYKIEFTKAGKNN